jgi:hypothetical protein
MNAVELAQWIIDNRYPKSEKEKVSDFEMFNFIVNNINVPVQPSIKSANALEIIDEMITEITEAYRRGKMISYFADEHLETLLKVKKRLSV